MAQRVKNLPAKQKTQVRSLVGKVPWRRAWQPTPVFLPWESHGQRSLVGYSLGGGQESGHHDFNSTIFLYICCNICPVFSAPLHSACLLYGWIILLGIWPPYLLSSYTLKIHFSHFHRTPLSWPNHSTKNPSITITTLGVRISIYECFRCPKHWVHNAETYKSLMLLNCGVGQDSWESSGQQGDQTSPS